MDLAHYVNDLQHQLEVAAEAGGDEARALAERLTAPLESATRLVLLEALSVAASEITPRPRAGLGRCAPPRTRPRVRCDATTGQPSF